MTCPSSNRSLRHRQASQTVESSSYRTSSQLVMAQKLLGWLLAGVSPPSIGLVHSRKSADCYPISTFLNAELVGLSHIEPTHKTSGCCVLCVRAQRRPACLTRDQAPLCCFKPYRPTSTSTPDPWSSTPGRR